MQSDEGRLRERKIGFLGGGNMAEALIRGLLQGGAVSAGQVRASALKGERLKFLRERYGIETTEDNDALCRWADVLVIAVKPQIVDRVLAPISAGLGGSDVVISVAAGVPIDAIEARLPEGARVIRSMPNTAAIALAGATAISAGSHATSDDVEIARTLFQAVGRKAVS